MPKDKLKSKPFAATTHKGRVQRIVRRSTLSVLAVWEQSALNEGIQEQTVLGAILKAGRYLRAGAMSVTITNHKQ